MTIKTRKVSVSPADDNLHPKQQRNQLGYWKSRRHFLLASLGFTIGFGNIWRFSWVAIENGGGAFLIPYLVMTFTLVLMMLRVEFKIGQHLRGNPIKMWSAASPYTCFLGVATSIICFTVASYYVIILCWCLHYFLNSFQSPLPWLFCDKQLDATKPLSNASSSRLQECLTSGPTSYYWYRETLNISDGLEDALVIQWQLAGVLIFMWIVVFLIAARGVQGMANIMYVTMIFPYLALLILTLRAMFLDGAKEGILHLFRPDWTLLTDLKVWAQAATQSLYSVGIGFGTMPLYAAMNPSGQNSLVDAFFIVLCDALTSVIGGIVVFSIMGFRATVNHNQCISRAVDDANASNGDWHGLNATGNWSIAQPPQYALANCTVNRYLEETSGGTGLAFISFTQTIIELPGASLFSAVFFLMLLSLGFSSFLGFIAPLFQVTVSVPWLTNRSPYASSGIICLAGLLLSSIFTTNSGDYLVQIFSAHGQNIPIIIISLVEVVAAGYLIKFPRVPATGRSAIGRIIDMACTISDKFVSPLLLMAILAQFLTNTVRISSIEYSVWDRKKGQQDKKTFPEWALVIAVGLAVVAILPIVVGLLYGLCLRVRSEKPETAKT